MMAIAIRLRDDGEIEGAWEVPIERHFAVVWSLLLGPTIVTLPLSLAVRNRLTISQQRLLGLLLAPPLFVASGILGWKLGGYLWPSRPLSAEEIERWRSGSK